jgi:hypothetical protein
MDNQEFFNELGNVNEMISNVLMVCEGMDAAGVEMKEKPFTLLARGVFGVLAFAMNNTFDRISELDSDFKGAFDVKYPCSMNDEEKKVWSEQRGRWL